MFVRRDGDLHRDLRRRGGGQRVYSLFKFRARPDDDSDGPPIHGHTGIEIAWTIPLVLVIAMISVSSIAGAERPRA